jgi:hypothetical protein
MKDLKEIQVVHAEKLKNVLKELQKINLEIVDVLKVSS